MKYLSLKKTLQNTLPYFAAAAASMLLLFLPPVGSLSGLLFWLWVACGAILIVCGFTLFGKGLLSAEYLCTLTALEAFLLRFYYVFYTPWEVRQHDVVGVGGHLEYIRFFCENGLTLPQKADLGLYEFYQFYHPPLYHFISGMWMKLNILLGAAEARTLENLQILTLFYSGCIMILFYRLLRELGLKGTTLVAAFSAAAFSPTLILLSGSINNDELCLLFSLLSLLAALRWYKEPSYTGAFCSALALGAAMLCKGTAVTAVPALILIFSAKLWQERKHWKPVFCQLAVFTITALPLCLAWNLYSVISLKLPPGYVPLMSSKHPLYIGNIPLWQRLFHISPGTFFYPYLCWHPDEHNILLTWIKTSAFGEFRWEFNRMASAVQPQLHYVASILFTGVLGTALFRSLYRAISRRKTEETLPSFFLITTAVFTISFFIIFCLKWPHIFTQNARYTSTGLLCAIAVTGLFLQDCKPRTAKVICAIIALYCCSSAFFFLACTR